MKTLRNLVIFLVLFALAAPAAFAAVRLRLSTTTSTENSGLLKVLLPPFEKRYHCHVDVIAVGTGKALKHGEAGDVDVVLVHARQLEDKFVAEGFGVDRRDVMYNDFIILGPQEDPARITGVATAAEALAGIARHRAPFFSRGDESGTHQKERELWQASGIAPAGTWYVEAGQGMGEVIIMATEKRAYTLADRGTYNAFKKDKTDLVIVFDGEPGLFNPYGVIAVNPRRHPHVNYVLARHFIDYITGPEGQKIIENFKVDGEQIFFIYKDGH
ncbi:MAG: solute-binding protein [Deltaproteobacteria bacterium]|nr:solute-binding protein [Deltaproteobacteria bacterium]